VDANSKVFVYQGLALVDLQQGQTVRAREHLGKILGGNLGNAETMRLLGVSYLLEGHPEDAIGPLDRAVRRDPEAAMAWNNLGAAYLMLRREDLACSAMGRAVQLAPRNEKFLEDLEALPRGCSGLGDNP
jgi:Flp pilus assembly protein TadD